MSNNDQQPTTWQQYTPFVLQINPDKNGINWVDCKRLSFFLGAESVDSMLLILRLGLIKF